MEILVDILTWFCLSVGSVFAVIGGVGIIRLPDFYTRLHGGGITDTLGAGLILVGLMLQAGLTLATLKLLMILCFLLITSPSSCHALAQSAMVQGVTPLQRRRREEPESS